MITQELKEKTQENHKNAEESDFMKSLFSGSLPIKSYVVYLTALQYIYDTLEATIRDNLDDDLINIFFDDKLERSWKISYDLKNLSQEITFNNSLTDAINEYMILIGKASPVELVAHHYIRYLGDLSGGQIIKRILKESYGLNDSQTSFYDFDLEPKQYRDMYKLNLENSIISDTDKRDFINAVNDIYRITNKILNIIK